MSNMSREVNTETNGDDQSVAGDHVDGEAHEVHEARHLHYGAQHTEDDKASTSETAQEHQDCDEHGHQGAGNVPV